MVLRDGRHVTPLDLQWHYLEHAQRYVKDRDAPAWAPDVLTVWERVLTTLEDDPMRLDGVVDWVTKYRLLLRYVELRRPVVGRRQARSSSTCSTTTCGRTGACTTGSWPPAGSSGS